MKIISIVLTLILLSIFLSIYSYNFIEYSNKNTKTWSIDKTEYTYYEEENYSLFKFHKPALYVQYYFFDKPYVIGHHIDPDGNNHGYYYVKEESKGPVSIE